MDEPERVDRVEVVEADDAADGHAAGFLGVVRHGRQPVDRRVLGRSRMRREPDRGRDGHAAGHVELVRHDQHVGVTSGDEQLGGILQVLPRVPAPGLEDVGCRHPHRPEVPFACLRLGVGVTRLLRPGDHDRRRVVLVPQQGRLLEPGPQVGRGHPVVLRRPHHDDGPGGLRCVLLSRPPHLPGRHPEVDEYGDEEVLDQAEQEPEHADGEERDAGVDRDQRSGPRASGPRLMTGGDRRRPVGPQHSPAGRGCGPGRAPRAPRTAAVRRDGR